VNVEEGVWYCHHCHWSGALQGHKPIAECREYFRPVFEPSEVTDPKVLEWFKTRKISEPTLAAWKIKSGPAAMPAKKGKGWETVQTIQFPFFVDGKVVNIKYRTGDKRFRQEKGAQKALYGLDLASKATSGLLICTEGEMDALALWEAGYRAVVSVPDGAPSADSKSFSTKFDFLKGTDEFFAKFKQVILATDGDEPGQRLREELARRIGYEKCHLVTWPTGCKDANDVLIKLGSPELCNIVGRATPYPVSGVCEPKDILKQVITLRHEPEGGFSPGWKNFQEAYTVVPGRMTVVTGIPSHGKSNFLDSMLVNLWRQYKFSTVVFSPENWPVQRHLQTLVEKWSEKHFYQMTDREIAMAVDDLQDGFHFVQPENDEDMMTVDAVLSRAKVMVFRYGVQGVVIDPWNEIEHELRAGEREDQYISRQLAKIRRFARMNKVHVWLVAHPRNLQKNKEGKYDPPTLYEISGGAHWRNKADMALCVYRPDMTTSETVVSVQKVRFRGDGKIGQGFFTYDVPTSTYFEKV
jgi:twinkle protein